MIVKKAMGKVIGAQLTSKEQEAMNIEILKQLTEFTHKHKVEIDALFLWFLHEEFGFGHKNLMRAYTKFAPLLSELCDRYDMHKEGDAIWLCTKKLKDYGIDLEQLEKERGD